ncbi:MAG: tetratricopeptide repeat protein [Alphaproteobacteria bacterium]|nr:tetratricopeptide repeat protein [Alphaproteobacteria bacterium]
MASQNKFKTAVQNFAKKIVKPSKAKRVVAGAAIVGGLMLGGASASHKREANTEHKSIKQTEFVVKDSLPQQKQTKVLQQKMDYSPVQLNSLEDMYTLFDKSLNIIFAELVLEEVPMQIPYDDYGLYKGKKNTVGVGSTYAPLDINDYNNPEAKWYHIASNQKIFANKTVSYEDMLKLVIGWAKYKTYAQNPKTKQFVKSQTVLERMFTKLKGCALTPNEFAAVFSAVYNNPRNLDKLCPIIRDNYKDKLKCANAIMFWDRNVASNSGLKDRCEFEANVFLNVDDFCEQMENFSTCPGRRSSCLGTKHVQRATLNKWNYKEWCEKTAAAYSNVVYTSVPGVTVGEICNDKNVKKLFTYVLEKKDNEQVKEVRNEYAKANKYLAKGNYEDALEQFLNMEQQGVYGTDLLNDIAATYAQLHQYDKSLEYFKKILETGETQAYSNACYKAGSVCEMAGKYKDAIAKYQQAIKYYKNYGVAGDNGRVKYDNLYQKAIIRAQSRQKSEKQLSKNKADMNAVIRRKQGRV